MTDDEVKRINDFIAERVMGWEKLWGGWHNGKTLTEYVFAQDDVTGYADVGILYDPYHNVAQAIEAADKWCDEHEPAGWVVRREKWLVSRHDGNMYNATMRWDICRYEKWAESTSYSAALCLALVAAVGAE